MTLGSTLPWRACSPLCRTPPLSFSAWRNPRVIAHRGFVRAQSTEPRATPPSDSAYSREEPDTADLFSLIDRLREIPVRSHGAWDPVVVKPVDRYPHKRETRNAQFRKRKELVQQARVEKRRFRPQPGDWRVVLQNLMKWTPTQAEPQDGIKVIIPANSVGLLLSDHKNNLWNIKSRAKCRMTLHVAADGTDEATAKDGDKGQVKLESGSPSEQDQRANTDPYVIFSGQPTAITDAIDEILKVTKTVSVVNLSGSPDTVLHDGQANEETVRGLVAHPSVTEIPIFHYQMSVPCQPYELRIRADKIPLPPRWTIATFQQYVAALVMGRCPRTLDGKLYTDKGTDSHQNTVVTLLLAVFNDPAASVAVSSPAFKLALTHFVRSGETFVNEARELIDRVRSLGLPMDTEVYNLLAETSVKSKNLMAFETTLDRMIHDGYKPDKRTWVLFLRMIEAEEVRRYVIHSMHSKNFFLDASVVQAVAAEMADHDIYRAIQLGQDVDEFLAGLRELYGRHWHLPPRPANRYLEFLARYSKFDEMKKLLEYMFEEKHCKPNTMMLNTILRHCRVQRKVDLAVEFVRMFDKHGFHVADDESIHYLFEMGRKIFKPHLLGAVWRYAHLARLDSSRMRHRGREFLDSGPDGAVKLLKLTDRIRRLWEGPKECKVARSEWVTSLLLYDYQKAIGDPGLVTLEGTAEGEEDQGPRKLAVELRPKEQYPRFASAFGEVEGASTSGMTQPEPATEPFQSSRPPTRIPSRKQKYDPYEKWVFERARDYKPAIGLGEFLQEALDRDRRLHHLVHTDEGVVKGGVPVDLVPPELPVVRVPRQEKKINRMWNWEGVREEQVPRFGGGNEALTDGQMRESGVMDEAYERVGMGKMDGMGAMSGKDEVDVIGVMREMSEREEKGEVMMAEMARTGGKHSQGDTTQPNRGQAVTPRLTPESQKKRTSEQPPKQAARPLDDSRAVKLIMELESQKKRTFESILRRPAHRADKNRVAMRRLELEPQKKQASEQPTKRHIDDLWDWGAVGRSVPDDLMTIIGVDKDKGKKQKEVRGNPQGVSHPKKAQGSARSKKKGGQAIKEQAEQEQDVWDKLLNAGAKIEQEEKRATKQMRASF